MNKKIEVAVSIGRNSRDEVHIRIEDRASSVEFVDVSMSYEEFAKALTGLSMVDATAEVRSLEVVGKTRIHETRKTLCPLDTYNKADLVDWLNKNCQEEGWTLQTYLGSQTSVKRTEAGTELNYSVIKYVDTQE